MLWLHVDFILNFKHINTTQGKKIAFVFPFAMHSALVRTMSIFSAVSQTDLKKQTLHHLYKKAEKIEVLDCELFIDSLSPSFCLRNAVFDLYG